MQTYTRTCKKCGPVFAVTVHWNMDYNRGFNYRRRALEPLAFHMQYVGVPDVESKMLYYENDLFCMVRGVLLEAFNDMVI